MLFRSGGNTNKHLSDETKQKIREAHLGIKMSEETRKKMSESRMGEKNPMYGQTHSEDARKKISNAAKDRLGRPRTEYQKECARLANLGKEVSEETRKKISEANKGNTPHNKNLRLVYCIELNKVFENASSAGKELNIRSSNIISCCEHIRKTCSGYHWMYANTDEYITFIKSLTT